MANLDDVVAGLELNAELSQDIHELQKDQFISQQKTESNIEMFVNTLKQQQLDNLERSSEQAAAKTKGSTFGKAVAQKSGEGVGAGIGLAAKGIGAGVGLASLGFGIGGFFTGLAAGDKAMTWMNTDMSTLTKVMKTLTDGFAEMNSDGLLKLGGLLTAGGVMGALLGPGGSMEAGFGMFALGAGIGGFFTGLAAGDKAMSWMNTDGTTLKNMMINLAEGLGAFAGRDLAALGAMLAAGALFGPSAASGAVGMGLIGAGIGAFFTGIAGMGKVAQLIGADGSTIRDIMVNLGEGLAGLSNPDIDMTKLLGFGPAMVSVAAGMMALTAGELVKGLGNFVSSLFTSEGEPSVFERIANDLKILSTVDVSGMQGFAELAKSMNDLGDGMDRIANTDMDDFKDNIEQLGKTVAWAIPLFDKMWNGGVIGEGWGDGYGEVDFGNGLKSVPADQIGESLSKIVPVAPALSGAVAERTMSTVGEQQGGITVINNNTNAPTTTQTNVNNGGGDYLMPTSSMNNSTRVDEYAL